MKLLNTTLQLVALAALGAGFVACRSETQNRFRRDVLDLANTRQYIILYSLDGRELFRGEVSGKVTRAEADESGAKGGEYVYWFDPQGRYYQTTLPYITTTDATRTGVLTRPSTTSTTSPTPTR